MAGSYESTWADLEVRRQSIRVQLDRLDGKAQRREADRGRIGVFYRNQLQTSLRRLREHQVQWRSSNASLLQRIDEALLVKLIDDNGQADINQKKRQYAQVIGRMKRQWMDQATSSAMDRLVSLEQSLEEASIAKVEMEQARAQQDVVHEQIRKQSANLQSLNDDIRCSQLERQARANSVQIERPKFSNSMQPTAQAADQITSRSIVKALSNAQVHAYEPLATSRQTRVDSPVLSVVVTAPTEPDSIVHAGAPQNNVPILPITTAKFVVHSTDLPDSRTRFSASVPDPRTVAEKFPLEVVPPQTNPNVSAVQSGSLLEDVRPESDPIGTEFVSELGSLSPDSIRNCPPQAIAASQLESITSPLHDLEKNAKEMSFPESIPASTKTISSTLASFDSQGYPHVPEQLIGSSYEPVSIIQGPNFYSQARQEQRRAKEAAEQAKPTPENASADSSVAPVFSDVTVMNVAKLPEAAKKAPDVQQVSLPEPSTITSVAPVLRRASAKSLVGGGLGGLLSGNVDLTSDEDDESVDSVPAANSSAPVAKKFEPMSKSRPIAFSAISRLIDGFADDDTDSEVSKIQDIAPSMNVTATKLSIPSNKPKATSDDEFDF